jgi:cell division protein FtsB
MQEKNVEQIKELKVRVYDLSIVAGKKQQEIQSLQNEIVQINNEIARLQSLSESKS